MIRTILAATLSVVLLCACGHAEETGGPWEPVRFLEGKWKGTGEGSSGVSMVEREYEFILGGHYLRGYNRSVFEPQERNPDGEVHENLDILSLDRGRGKIVLRQFHIEGFTNTYVLDSVSGDGGKLVFITEHIENGPPGMSARLIIERTGGDSFGERFELSTGGQEYSCLVRNRFERVE